eukprot:TRINITY_DN108163_c0_g1_i1.p1 TRINITY_DN108163_c0_g1~~TRINITY_DN108163_c0_g1_i1.p1  ORF type:complete len:558 (-),score=71.47 TRINITY_DN108163_c0_g1_i1:46-1719(-)
MVSRTWQPIEGMAQLQNGELLLRVAPSSSTSATHEDTNAEEGASSQACPSRHCQNVKVVSVQTMPVRLPRSFQAEIMGLSQKLEQHVMRLPSVHNIRRAHVRYKSQIKDISQRHDCMIKFLAKLERKGELPDGFRPTLQEWRALQHAGASSFNKTVTEQCVETSPSQSSAPMPLSIRYGKETILLDNSDTTWTLGKLRSCLDNHFEVLPRNQVLHFNGQALKASTKRLVDYGLQAGDVIELKPIAVKNYQRRLRKPAAITAMESQAEEDEIRQFWEGLGFEFNDGVNCIQGSSLSSVHESGSPKMRTQQGTDNEMFLAFGKSPLARTGHIAVRALEVVAANRFALVRPEQVLVSSAAGGFAEACSHCSCMQELHAVCSFCMKPLCATHFAGKSQSRCHEHGVSKDICPCQECRELAEASGTSDCGCTYSTSDSSSSSSSSRSESEDTESAARMHTRAGLQPCPKIFGMYSKDLLRADLLCGLAMHDQFNLLYGAALERCDQTARALEGTCDELGATNAQLQELDDWLTEADTKAAEYKTKVAELSAEVDSLKHQLRE